MLRAAITLCKCAGVAASVPSLFWAARLCSFNLLSTSSAFENPHYRLSKQLLFFFFYLETALCYARVGGKGKAGRLVTKPPVASQRFAGLKAASSSGLGYKLGFAKIWQDWGIPWGCSNEHIQGRFGDEH